VALATCAILVLMRKAMVLVASLLVVTACSSSTPTKTFSMGRDGPTFRYPTDWHAAAKPLAKNESSKQVGAFATFDLPVNARACGDYPVTAFERAGPKDAIVVVLEQPRVDSAPPLPSDVLGAIEDAPFGEGPPCPPVPSGGMVWPDHILFFSKDGRRFIANVTFGEDVSQRTKKQAAGILSSLHVR
jgi:hypothetical protein